MARPTRPQRDHKVQPPRPPNAWILYRSDMFRRIRDSGDRMSQANVSKLISDMWRNETEEVKRHYEQEAETRKAQHQEQYPDYRFCPKRKEPRVGRRKSKARDATTPDADENAHKSEDADADAHLSLSTFPVVSYIQPRPQSRPPLPTYHHGLAMPQPFLVPYVPEVHYGPGGLSPPVSAVASPAPHERSDSPLQPRSVSSSSSSSSTRPSPSSESQASSSRLSVNPTHLPSLPSSHRPSPNPYATPSLPTLLQNSAPGELRLASPRLQLQSAENTVPPTAPAWSNNSTYLPTPISPNPEEVPNFNIAITQRQTYTEAEQATSPSTPFDPLQALLLGTGENGVFNLSNIESSALLTHPQGELEVALGPQAEIVDYSDDFFAEFDFDEFQRQMESVAEGSSNYTMDPRPVPEDLRSLFHARHNPDIQPYATTQQRQPSAFTQEMMGFLNFEATEDSTEAPTETPTIAPQQVRLQSPPVAPAMPIFTQMTNTPAFTSGNQYVPPAGAIYSSNRRVGGSWKPSFTVPDAQIDESFSFWNP